MYDIIVLKNKIYRAMVTSVNINYIGSITIDSELMESSGIHKGIM